MTPTVSIVNLCRTTALPFTVGGLANSLQNYIDKHVGPEWAVGCKVEVLDNPQADSAALDHTLQGKWGLLLLDTTDQADAEGYHDFGSGGEPRAFCFAETTLEAGDDFAVTVSHELAEMLVDPQCNSYVHGKGFTWYVREICDAVEASDFEVANLRMSNFVNRAWFETNPASPMFDHLNVLRKPFSLAKGGYTSVWTPMHGWSQLYGSKLAKDYVEAHKTHSYSRPSRRTKKIFLAASQL